MRRQRLLSLPFSPSWPGEGLEWGELNQGYSHEAIPRESVCECVCVRESVFVCVCVCVRERERDVIETSKVIFVEATLSVRCDNSSDMATPQTSQGVCPLKWRCG